MSFSLSLILKQNMHPRHLQWVTSFTKPTNLQRLILKSKLRYSLNIKCMPPPLVVANSYGLELDEITMLELGSCRWNIKDKWNHFWYVVFDMGCNKGL